MNIYSPVIPTQAGIQSRPNTFDIVVIGAGGAGMVAALFAALNGASVLLVEPT